MRTELEFERSRGKDFEEKYKGAIKYKNEEAELKQILNQLNQQLTAKENQLLQLLPLQQEKNRLLAEKEDEAEELARAASALKSELGQIKEAAFSAIVEKDAVIAELTEKI